MTERGLFVADFMWGRQAGKSKGAKTMNIYGPFINCSVNCKIPQGMSGILQFILLYKESINLVLQNFLPSFFFLPSLFPSTSLSTFCLFFWPQIWKLE